MVEHMKRAVGKQLLRRSRRRAASVSCNAQNLPNAIGARLTLWQLPHTVAGWPGKSELTKVDDEASSGEITPKARPQ